MSDIIRLLPESIANQIAAGEVVTAPSAAVKELLENAIDAGATSIQLEVTDGGKASIHVLDNGCGMSPSDARMAFEKHATSKIRKAEDLYHLHTMGFRGEALAAISAISQIELRTRRADSETGTRILISGGTVSTTEAVVAPIGTSIRVKDLFFNVPARRRFLGTDKTEFKKVLKEFVHVALVNPSIAMSLHSDGTLIKDLPTSGLKERILSVVGRTFDKKLLSIHYTSPSVSITGYVSHPQTATKRGYEQYMFVNGRYMRHPYFQKAIELAFDGLIPESTRPSFFVYLTVPTENIDINISPTKTEIRFAEEQLIFPLLKQLVREALSASAAIPVLDFDHQQTIDIPAYTGRREILPNPEPSATTTSGGFTRRVFFGGGKTSDHSKDSTPAEYSPKSSHHPSSFDVDWDSLGDSFNHAPEEAKLFPTEPEPTSETALSEFAPTHSPEPASSGHILYRGRYLVTPLRHHLLLIDYRRAQFRILYEKLLITLNAGHIETERLLFPEALELTLLQKEMLETIRPEVEAFGFVLQESEQGSYTIVEAPAIISSRAVAILHELLAHCIETGEVGRDYLERTIAIAMADLRSHSLNPQLEQGDVEEFLAQLFATTDPNTTPRGHTIITTFHADEIDRRFV